MAKSSKGGQFERKVAVDLSLWWSRNRRDDLFWRSQTSGARATTRAKRGKDTTGQHGDIAHTHPDGASLMDLVTIEVKRGYQKDTLQDVFDRASTHKPQTWDVWFEKVHRSHQLAGSFSWMLICRRNRREELILTPSDFYHIMLQNSVFKQQPSPLITFKGNVLNSDNTLTECEVHGMHFGQFLRITRPNKLRKLSLIV